jgi:hypothetical protein
MSTEASGDGVALADALAEAALDDALSAGALDATGAVLDVD